jgi:hypothetical protein
MAGRAPTGDVEIDVVSGFSRTLDSRHTEAPRHRVLVPLLTYARLVLERVPFFASSADEYGLFPPLGRRED